MNTNEISVTVEADRATVSLLGEHEAFSADRLQRRLDALVAEGTAIEVDLRRTQFVDSTVIGVLVGTRRRAADAGLNFRLVLGPETGWPVRRVLEVTHLLEQFEVVG